MGPENHSLSHNVYWTPKTLGHQFATFMGTGAAPSP